MMIRLSLFWTSEAGLGIMSVLDKWFRYFPRNRLIYFVVNLFSDFSELFPYERVELFNHPSHRISDVFPAIAGVILIFIQMNQVCGYKSLSCIGRGSLIILQRGDDQYIQLTLSFLGQEGRGRGKIALALLRPTLGGYEECGRFLMVALAQRRAKTADH